MAAIEITNVHNLRQRRRHRSRRADRMVAREGLDDASPELDQLGAITKTAVKD